MSDGKGNLYVNLEEQNETLHIDVKSLKVIDRWALAPCGTPTALSMDIENKRLFVGCRSKHLAVLNAETGKVVFTAPIGERVDAGAFDSKTRLVYLSTGDGKVFVFHQDSPDKYSVAQEITTKTGAKTMGFDPKTGNLFVPTSKMVQWKFWYFRRSPEPQSADSVHFLYRLVKAQACLDISAVLAPAGYISFFENHCIGLMSSTCV